MKKFLSLILILICLLTACADLTGENAGEGNTEDAVTTTTDKVTETGDTSQMNEGKKLTYNNSITLSNPLPSGNTDGIHRLKSSTSLSAYSEKATYFEVEPIKPDNNKLPTFEYSILLVDDYDVFKEIFENSSELKIDDIYDKSIFDEYFFIIINRVSMVGGDAAVKYAVDFDSESQTLSITMTERETDPNMIFLEVTTSFCDFVPVDKNIFSASDGSVVDINKINLKFFEDIRRN